MRNRPPNPPSHADRGLHGFARLAAATYFRSPYRRVARGGGMAKCYAAKRIDNREDLMPQRRIGHLVATTLLVCLLGQTPCQAQDDLSEHPVYLAFSDYRSAIIQADAESALRAVDSSTLQYYSEMLNHALNSDEATVRGLSIMDLLMVMSIRHRLTPEQVKGMDASSLFKYGVANGWTGKESVIGLDVVHVEVDGQTATATFTSNGAESPVPFQFDKEGGQWKIDLTSIMGASGSAFSQMAEQQGITDVELVSMLLGMVSGEEVDAESIWIPVNQR